MYDEIFIEHKELGEDLMHNWWTKIGRVGYYRRNGE